MSETGAPDVLVGETSASAERTILLLGPASMFHDALRAHIERSLPGTSTVHIADESDLAGARGELVLFDIDLEVANDARIQQIAKLIGELAPRPVLLISGTLEPDVLQRLLRDGIAGIVPKHSSFDVLLEAIEAVSSGKVWLQRDLLTQTFADSSHRSRRICSEAAKIAQLTQRERDIVTIACSGLTNRQMATRLEISEATVRHHLSSIFNKLGLQNRGELIVFSYRHGLIGESDRELFC